MADWGNMIIVVFMVYYTFYFIQLISKRNRQAIKFVNTALDNLRSKPIKTLEEQKKFLDLRYPKKPKFKFRWVIIPQTLFGIAKFILFFQLYNFLIGISTLIIPLWVAILFVMTAPIIINILLEKFNLQKSSDMRIFLGGRKK